LLVYKHQHQYLMTDAGSEKMHLNVRL
jgi:hypothetical protein